MQTVGAGKLNQWDYIIHLLFAKISFDDSGQILLYFFAIVFYNEINVITMVILMMEVIVTLVVMGMTVVMMVAMVMTIFEIKRRDYFCHETFRTFCKSKAFTEILGST